MGRIGRSFQLVGQSYRILMKDKKLMVLPLISGIFIVAVLASVAAGFSLGGQHPPTRGPQLYLPIFLFYVVTYTIGIFFQAAVIAGATERMRGGDPTVGSALGAAGHRFWSIVMWAVVAATAGMIIRAIHDRVGFVGRLLTGLLGIAWSLATFFIVPVLVLEDRSIPDSFKRSVSVFRQTWGETAVGGTTLGAAVVCAWLTLILITGLLAMAIGIWALAVFVVGAAVLMIFFSALQGVFIASLYRFATGGAATSGLDPSLLGQVFVPKNR
jgi:hypothetical protein